MIVFLWVLIANLINVFFVGEILNKDLGNVWSFLAISIGVTVVIVGVAYPIMLKVRYYLKVVVGSVLLNITILGSLYITILDYTSKDVLLILTVNGIIHFVVLSLIMAIGTEVELYKRMKRKE